MSAGLQITSRLVLACFLWVGGKAVAQDYQRYAPNVPPPTSTPSQLPNSPYPVTGSDQDLGVKLKAVVFVDDPKKIVPGVLHAGGVLTGDIALLNYPDFDAVVAPYLDKPISLRSMNQLIEGVIVYCRKHDRPVVDVSIPEQDLTGGVVQLLFIEGKVDKVEARGNRWFSNSLIEDGIQLKPGDSISACRLLNDLDTLNQNPFRNSNAILAAGTKPGSTDIIVQTQDRFPLRTYAGYEDNGNALTGYDRWEAGFNWGNVFGLGQQLNYQFTTSSNFDSLKANSASYIIPLPERQTLILYGAISTSNVISSGFDFQGGGSQLGLRYEIPLATFRGGDANGPITYTQSIYAGYDWKQSDNFIEFGVIPVTNTITDIGEGVLGYRGNLTDPWGTLSFNPEIDGSPAQVWDFQNDAAYAAARPGADPVYLYFKGDLNRTTQLPWGFSLVNELRGQISTTNLLPSEQIIFGGEASIRGYNDEDINNTDDGWILRNELRMPSLSLGQFFLPKSEQSIVSDQLQFFAFYDCGQAWAHQGYLTLNNGTSVSKAIFAGVGPGLRYTVGPYFVSPGRLRISAPRYRRHGGVPLEPRRHLQLLKVI